MAQLKSFKYIEGAEQESASSPRSSLSSIGAILTASDGNNSISSPMQQADETHSHSQESQSVRHDLQDEESNDEQISRLDRFNQDDDHVTRISIEAESSSQQARRASPRIDPLGPLRQPAVNSGSPLPKSTAWRPGFRAPAGDSVSQCSLGQRPPAAGGSSFEIRWQGISLMARKSKVPAFIEDSSLYRLLARGKQNQTAESLEEASLKASGKMYQSPSLIHKIIPPTISEEAELSSTKIDIKSTPSSAGLTASTDSKFRPILVNVSGSVFSGQLTAVLGPSGVGKTMLLNTLTGRNQLEGVGRVSLLGATNQKRMSVVSVPQADVLPGKLTTREDLEFTSRLKNTQQNFNHDVNIKRIVALLQMEKFLDTRIDKLSGGEARRLSIGRELLNSPDIMILDEPTSGLDANTCKKIIVALRELVEHSENTLGRPMSIIVTIHQPQQEVLNQFHRVYVMAVGGRAIYEGPPTALLPTLVEQSSLKRVTPIEQLNENPAIVALEVASGEFGPNVIDELAFYHESQFYDEAVAFNETNSPYSTPRNKLRKSPLSVTPRFGLLHRTRVNSIDSSIGRPTPILAKRLSGPFDKLSTVTSVSYCSAYDSDLPDQVGRLKVDKRLRRSVVMRSDLFHNTRILMQRCWLQTIRDPFLMAIRIIGFILVAAGTVQIYAHSLDPNEHQCPLYETEIDNVITFMQDTKYRLGNLDHMLKQSTATHTFFFHVLLCVLMVTSALTGLVFPLQMRMFLREHKNGWYSAASFTLSQTLAELPVDFIGPIITLLITFPLCHQPESEYHWREIGYGIVLVLTCLITKSQAQIVGAIFMDSVENSVFLSCVAIAPQSLFSGITVRIASLSYPLQLVSYGFFLRYSFESLNILRYYGICDCNPEFVHGYPTRTTSVALPDRLNKFVNGIFEFNSPINATDDKSLQLAQLNNTIPFSRNNNDTSVLKFDDSQDGNIFIRFMQLVSDANNLFVPNMEELGNCTTSRSLYLMNMGISVDILPLWLVIMFAIFIISRFLTYFVIKAVIRFRCR